jgi:hypothetical protein
MIFDDQKLYNFTAEENHNFLIKILIYLLLASIKDVQAMGEALKKEHAALKNKKFLLFFLFCASFLPSWIRIRIPKADLDPQH